jgi:hypothetical protein
MKLCVREAGQRALQLDFCAQGSSTNAAITPDLRHLRSGGAGGRNNLPARHLKFPVMWSFAAARGSDGKKVGAKSIRGGCHELFSRESVDLFFLFSGAVMIPRRSGRRVGFVVGGTRGKRPWPAGSRDWDPPASSHDGQSCGGPARPRILTAHGFEIAFLDARCGWSCPLKLKIRHHAAVGRWIFAATDRSGLGPLGAPPARRFEWKFLGQLVGLQNVIRVNVRPAAWS